MESLGAAYMSAWEAVVALPGVCRTPGWQATHRRSLGTLWAQFNEEHQKNVRVAGFAG
jgi:hypothetical protein